MKRRLRNQRKTGLKTGFRAGSARALSADANAGGAPPIGELVVPDHGRGKIWRGRCAHPKAGPGVPRRKYLDIDDPAERARLLKRDYDVTQRAERAASQRARLEDPLARAKYAARQVLARAVFTGKIVKPSRCPRCRTKVPPHLLYAHIRDHTEPLNVNWRCAACWRAETGVDR